ncbi:MAG: Dabb family protein [Planctomycetaceae bacterium]
MSRSLLVMSTLIVLGVFAMNRSNQADTPTKPEKLLRHVVLFKFTDDAKPAQIKAVETAFAALPSKIDAIHGFEWGTNNSPEPHAQGYTHCFLVTFRTEEDREKYLPHPEHLKFVEVLKPILDQVHVVDYWTQQ